MRFVFPACSSAATVASMWGALEPGQGPRIAPAAWVVGSAVAAVAGMAVWGLLGRYSRLTKFRALCLACLPLLVIMVLSAAIVVPRWGCGETGEECEAYAIVWRSLPYLALAVGVLVVVANGEVRRSWDYWIRPLAVGLRFGGCAVGVMFLLRGEEARASIFGGSRSGLLPWLFCSALAIGVSVSPRLWRRSIPSQTS